MFLKSSLPAQLAGNPIAEQQQRRGTAANKGCKHYGAHGSILNRTKNITQCRLGRNENQGRHDRAEYLHSFPGRGWLQHGSSDRRNAERVECGGQGFAPFIARRLAD